MAETSKTLAKILVFGASGRTGIRFVEYALAAGHIVTIFVRDPSKFSLKHENLNVVEGDLSKDVDLPTIVKGHDIVVSTLGGKVGDQFVEGVYVKKIIEAMETTSVPRMIFVAGAGILQETEEKLRNQNPNFPAQLKAVSASHLQYMLILYLITQSMERSKGVKSGMDCCMLPPPP
jgi:putative NADH-flavin reductase